VPEGFVKMGVLWSAHFQDACAAFGMKNALITMMTEPEMFKAVIDRITEFRPMKSSIGPRRALWKWC